VVDVEGFYEDYLEDRLPSFVRSCPHWAAKGLTEVELDPLLKAAGVEGSIEFAIYGPRSSGAVVQQLPAEFLAKLGSLDKKVVAMQWAATMSTTEHTHYVTGVKLSDGWTESQAQNILALLCRSPTRHGPGASST